MFYLSKDKELTPIILDKMINDFQVNVLPQRRKYKNYYDGLQRILQKSYSDASKPCNKTIINYCKNIVDAYCGYIATPGYISYSSDSDINEIMNILRYNDYQTEDNSFLLDALVYGVAFELMYTDDEGKTRFNLVRPTQGFGICDDSLTGELDYFVRIYKVSDWSNTDTTYVEVYSDKRIKTYKQSPTLKLISDRPHYFNQCPVNILALPDEKSIFDCIMSEQDSVNELISCEIDDYSAFCDAYLVLTGVDADNKDIAQMKQNRVLLLPEGALATYLTKNSNDSQIENIMQRLHDSIYRISQCVDYSSENFVGGVASGIAIQYRLSGMENRAGIIEGCMKKALQRRVEIICGIASLKLGEEVYRDIRITFKRNLPEDMSSKVDAVSKLKGIVSDKTLLEQLSIVDDVNKEMEEIQKDKTANMSLYNFGSDIDE